MARLDYTTDEDQDSRLNPADPAAKLSALENQQLEEMNNNYHSSTADPSQEDANIKRLEEQGGWVNNTGKIKSDYGGNRTASGHWLTKANFRGVWKKRGVWGVITLVLGMLGIGGAFFLPPALLPIHIMENMAKRFDTQNTSFTIRSNRIIAAKLSDKATDGNCDVIKIACRFSRPSNYLLKNLTDNKIIPLDKSGNPIDIRKGPFPNQRPATYEFTDSKGSKISVKASEVSKFLNDNAEFRAAMHTAFNPRFVSWGDSVVKSIYARFGATKRDVMSDAKDQKAVNDKLNEVSKGETNSAVTSEADSVLSKILKDKMTTVLDKLKKSGKGSTAQMIAAAACLATDTPRLFTSVARDYELGKIIPFSTALLAETAAIKAGKGTATEATALGDSVTKVVNNKSAMDSAGMRSLLYGDTSFDSKSYQKFIPGGSVLANTKDSIKVLSGPAVKNACSVATNPVTGAALNMFLVANAGDTLGASLVVAGINITLSWATSFAIDQFGGQIIDAMMPFLKGISQPVLASILGDLTQNISGTDFGDAYVSGASHMMGQVANGGGNVPLTVDQAVKYNASTQAVQTAYAEEDRITQNPFDATNSNTVVGSFVNRFLPYYAQMGTVPGALSAIGSIATGSFKSLVSAHAAPSAADQYQLCNDPSVTQANIAAGPFCNIYYGIPTDYLGNDPNDVMNYMLQNKDIDEVTGEAVPGSEYDSFKQLCTDGSTDQLTACTIGPSNTAETNQKLAMFALWTTDHRAQKIMDNQDTATESTSTASTSLAGSTNGTAVKGDDYPYKNDTIDDPSPLGYLKRECVDFVSWRLNEQSSTTKEPFSTKFMGFGNAVDWASRAAAAGFAVNDTPALGSVAWWGAFVSAGGFSSGDMGHVAIVSGINPDGSIVIEQYNVAIPNIANYHEYSKVTISADGVKNLKFIHMADIGATNA